MTSNIKIRIGIIVAVILVCLYGIIGIPKSKDELVANWKKNIHLGLDLSGGTQLVMQVQLQDAFKAAADNTIDALEAGAAKGRHHACRRHHAQRSHDLEDADKIEIDVKGVPSDKSGRVPRASSTISSAHWVPTALNSTDYKLTMKPSEALKMKQDTLTQTMATIERKINALGLAESSVQPTGRSDAEAELLVQLPGVDDPAHVKQLLQTQAVLEWDEVKDGPFNSREEALSKHGGILPLNTKLVPTAGARRTAELVSGVAHAGRPRHRYPRRQRGARRVESLGDEFRAHPGCRQALRGLHRGQHRQPRRHRGGWHGHQRAHHSKQDQRHRPHHRRQLSQEEAADLALNLRAGSLPASVKSRKNARWVRRWAPIPSGKALRPVSRAWWPWCSSC